MRIVQLTLVMTLMFCIVAVSMLIGLNAAWNNSPQQPEQPPVVDNGGTDNQLGGNGQEDAVTRPANVILSNNANVTVSYLGADGKPAEMDKDTVFFGSDIAWTPGHAEVVYLALENKGETKTSYSLSMRINDETFITKSGAAVKLSELLQFGFVEVEEVFESTAAALDALESTASVSSNFAELGSIEPGKTVAFALVVYLPEGAGDLLEAGKQTISLGLSMFFTAPKAPENDDETVVTPEIPEYFEGSESVENIVVDGVISEPVTIGGGENSSMSAVVPEGVKLEEGVTELTFSVTGVETPNEDVPVSEDETAKAIDVHIEGVAEDNDVPMIVTLKKLFSKGLNSTSIKMYHIENDTPVEMTLVTNPTNHNEFSYDPATGDVVMAVASFSQYVTIENDYNRWEGGFDYSWYIDKSSPYTISSAEQLAGLGKIVDGTADGIEADDFNGKTVFLGGNIDLSGGVSFNPIGFGYDYAGYNSGGKAGYVFKGTFDGQGYTISNLNVNGWDIGIWYSNSGGGLFASVCDATIKNLTMKDASVVMECVEQGVIAGLAQGTCTFENINIIGCSVANYQRATGGVVGEVSPKYNADGTVDTNNLQTHTFRNVFIDSTTVVGSLWGDFDAPVGGVIGGYWGDDLNTTKVNMENVTVACRLDVYNDVTSSYQWYAYRRAGMLIGNTDQGVDHKATADFLTCKNVKAYYGDWANYHYCEFSNHNSKWPWVRVEEGENCSAYSNPRYGVPNDPVTGQPVTSIDHNHSGDDEHNVELRFNQLYGGGQGVYGETAHEGVTVQNYYYKVEYINDGKTHYEVEITSPDAYTVLVEGEEFNEIQSAIQTQMNDNTYLIEYWMNAGSTKVETIPAGNMEDIKLYPSFKGRYTATFVDQDGNVLDWIIFTADDAGDTKVTNMAAATTPPTIEKFEFKGEWEVHITNDLGETTSKTPLDSFDFTKCTTDITVYPIYNYNGSANLTPVDSDGDGDTDYYQVDGANVPDNYDSLSEEEQLPYRYVEIPAEVNGRPVTTISLGAFADFPDITEVIIPSSVTHISANAFAGENSDGFLGSQKLQQVTLKYEGTYDNWKAKVTLEENWDQYMGDGSRIIYSDGTYLELAYEKYTNWYVGWRTEGECIWRYHSHAVGNISGCTESHYRNQ